MRDVVKCGQELSKSLHYSFSPITNMRLKAAPAACLIEAKRTRRRVFLLSFYLPAACACQNRSMTQAKGPRACFKTSAGRGHLGLESRLQAVLAPGRLKAA